MTDTRYVRLKERSQVAAVLSSTQKGRGTNYRCSPEGTNCGIQFDINNTR